MKLSVWRKWPTDKSTIGELSVDGVYECFSLEPPRYFNGLSNVPMKTCINEGVYDLTLAYSPKHSRIMPLVLNVPGRTEIEIHPLNWPSETEGCLGVGQQKGDDQIMNSVAAFNVLFAKIKDAINAGDKVTIAYFFDPQPLEPT